MKKEPQRLCIACRAMRPKSELIRLVCTEEGVKVDLTGKAQSRGCYLCRSGECVAKAKKTKGLERSFKRAIDPQVYVDLADYVAKS